MKVDRNRVLHIPLSAGADYRSVFPILVCIASLFIVLAGLPPDQFEWQFADPSSSIARAKYRPGDVYAYSCSLWGSNKKVGVYGRLDKDGFFPTTVTNMDPTAKQCQVLHPSVGYLSELGIYAKLL